MNSFHKHYGRWVALDEELPTEDTLSYVHSSQLLLCACCLIAVRHIEQQTSSLAAQLFHEVKTLVSEQLLVVPQTLAFFQAVLVLSLWSTTIGQTLLSLDSWMLSGYALQQSLACEAFRLVMDGSISPSMSQKDLSHWRIYNHTCLVHLQ